VSSRESIMGGKPVTTIINEVKNNDELDSEQKIKVTDNLMAFNTKFESISGSKEIEENITAVASVMEMANNATTPWEQEAAREALDSLLDKEIISQQHYLTAYGKSNYQDNLKLERNDIERKYFAGLKESNVRNNLVDMIKGVMALRGEINEKTAIDAAEAKDKLRAYRYLYAQEALDLFYKNNTEANSDQRDKAARSIQAEVLGWTDKETINAYEKYLDSHNIKPDITFLETVSSKPKDFKNIGSIMENGSGKKALYLGNGKVLILDE